MKEHSPTRIARAAAPALLLALTALLAPADTIDASAFSQSFGIRFQGYSGSTALTDFPVLVKLSEATGFQYAKAAAGGADLRFALADGTLLSHEIDTWDPSGVSTVWVKVPTLDATTEIKAHYGCSGTPPAVATGDVPVPTRFAKTFLGWYTEENGAGTKWFNADGSVANAPEIYETIGSTTLYAAWRDEDVTQWRVDLDGIEVGTESVVLSLKAASAEKFAEARKHLRVYASPTLPVPETADAIIATPEIVDNGDGTDTATIQIDQMTGAQFYEIGVGE